MPLAKRSAVTMLMAVYYPALPATQPPNAARRGHHDHRLPRPLHDSAEGARNLPAEADRGPQGARTNGLEGDAQHQRRPDSRIDRKSPAEAPTRARHGRDHLLAACRGHVASYRRRDHEPALVAALQRADPPGLLAVPAELRRGLPAAADAGRAAEQLHRRARALREGLRLHRLQP